MTGADPKFLLAFLNSMFSMFYFANVGTTTGVGTVRWLKYKLEEFPIPENTPERSALILPLVERVLDGDMSAAEEIDEVIFDMIELTAEEREHIKTKIVMLYGEANHG
jgi:hypothetical protein